MDCPIGESLMRVGAVVDFENFRLDDHILAFHSPVHLNLPIDNAKFIANFLEIRHFNLFQILNCLSRLFKQTHVLHSVDIFVALFSHEIGYDGLSIFDGEILIGFHHELRDFGEGQIKDIVGIFFNSKLFIFSFGVLLFHHRFFFARLEFGNDPQKMSTPLIVVLR